MIKKPKTVKLKPIPRFDNEADERAFRETHDTSSYIDWSKKPAEFDSQI